MRVHCGRETEYWRGNKSTALRHNMGMWYKAMAVVVVVALGHGQTLAGRMPHVCHWGYCPSLHCDVLNLVCI